MFHSYAWLSSKALSNSRHTACETAVELQSLLCCPFYPLFMGDGASRQTIESLPRCGLCISVHGEGNLDCATAPYSLLQQHQYRYVDFRGAVLICTGRSPVSGTFTILYKPKNVDLKDMRLAPMLQCVQRATSLVFKIGRAHV